MTRSSSERPRFDTFDKGVLAVLGGLMISSLVYGYETTPAAGTYNNHRQQEAAQGGNQFIKTEFQDPSSGMVLALEAGVVTARCVDVRKIDN